MDNNRNLILAMVLSVGVLFAWQALVVVPREAARKEAAAQIALEEGTRTPTQPNALEPGATNPLATPGAPVAPTVGPDGVPQPDAAATTEPTAAQAEAPRIAVESGRLTGTINLRGARVDDLKLNDYRETVEETSPNIRLLSPGGINDTLPGVDASGPLPYFAEFGFFGANAGQLPGPETVWEAAEGASLTPQTPVTLTHTNDAGLRFERTIALDGGYMFSIIDRVTNTGATPVSIQSYGRIARFGEPVTAGIYVLHEGLVGAVGEEGVDEIDYDDVREDGQIARAPATNGWLGITDKYWATALVPSAQNGAFTATYKYILGARPFYQTDYASAPLAIAPGATVQQSARLFAGAKKVDIIDAYEEGDQVGSNGLDATTLAAASQPVPKLSNLVDWGWFYFITKPMFSLMNWFYGLVGNFGVAILLTTVVIKLIFFPLANISYKSMAKMKVVAPEMAVIKERHGDDRQAQQKAMMELYREKGINPAAGCLPVLLQIPVFFALYKVIYVTIEMRHAPFFGWVQDLSAPDPTSIFNLFGLLPYEVPLLLMIGVWPLIMGITMFIQMQMNPAPPDPTQAMIFKWMPVVFTLMLATFPAGLVIYWAWNNFLSILQQGTIMKRQGAKIELWDNLKGMFGRKGAEPAE